MELTGRQIRISVRNLVEFVLRSGDIDNRRTAGAQREAMLAGGRMHRKIQRRMGSGYQAEVSLRHSVEEDGFQIVVEGRADGIIRDGKDVTIDEIKCVYQDINCLEEAVGVHMAQARCYGYIYGLQEALDEVTLQLTYCNLETEEIRRFQEIQTMDELSEWFAGLIHEYVKWARYLYHNGLRRDESIKALEFPYPYRAGQRDLAVAVYRTLERGRRLFVQAPTGIGKTLSTVFPALKAIGEGHGQKLFYLTAKTITRTVAEEALAILRERGLYFRSVTITAKEKMCFLEGSPECNPASCPYAKGYYDRVNDCVYDMLIHENDMNRDTILSYAEKHNVCPFEMCLDAALFADSIICDYNYAFDPNVYLRRFFSEEKKGNFAFLIDEAHNLVDRAREMYSAVLVKEDFLKVKRIINEESTKNYPSEIKYLFKIFAASLDRCNKTMLEWKHACDHFELLEDISSFEFQLLRVINSFELLTKEVKELPERETILNLFFAVRHFLNMNDTKDEKYRIYTDYEESGNFRIKLQCMDPSTRLSDAEEQARSTVFFSATLLPIRYYMEQLSTTEEDYAVYAKSSFTPDQRRIVIANDVTSKYTRRSVSEYRRIAGYIEEFVQAKQGNYIIFFPSYAFLRQVKDQLHLPEQTQIVEQCQNMSESEKEEFLASFDAENDYTLVGLCVMGGIFSEGIDLKEDRLIGTAIVGTGLPQVCEERELFKQYYDEKNGHGFDYAYLYPGINKVFQAGGRVIRTSSDRGVILLLDERFAGNSYSHLFPKEWVPYKITNKKGMKDILHSFWENPDSSPD